MATSLHKGRRGEGAQMKEDASGFISKAVVEEKAARAQQRGEGRGHARARA
jgi:hypothetical protein